MSAQPGPVVTVHAFAAYRNPAPVPADPAPPPPPPPPPSLGHLFDNAFAVRSLWAWRLKLAMALAISAGFVVAFLQALASGADNWFVMLPFVIVGVPVLVYRLHRLPRAIYAEPAGLRFVWSKRTAFFPWDRVRPWSLRQLLVGRWVLDVDGGPYRVYPVWLSVVPRLYRVGQLLATAHAGSRDASEAA